MGGPYTGTVYNEINVDTYPVTFTFTAQGGNYSGTRTRSVEGAILARPIDELPTAAFTAEGHTRTFNTLEQVVASAAINTSDHPGLTGTLSYSTDGTNWIDGNAYRATDAGTYPVTFRFVASGNYSGTLPISVEGIIEAKELSEAEMRAAFLVQNAVLPWNGNAQRVAWAWFNEAAFPTLEGTISYRPYRIDPDTNSRIYGDVVNDDEHFETQVGSYPIDFTFVATGNYTGTYNRDITGYINPINVPDPQAAFPVTGVSKVFNGSPQVIVTTGFNTLDYPGLSGLIEYYSVDEAQYVEGSSFSATNVGSYPVTFRYTLSGAYTGTYNNTGTGHITPAPLSPDSADFEVRSYEPTYTGEALVVADASFDDALYPGLLGSISYTTPTNSSPVNGSSYTGIDAGDYPVTFTFTAGGNYSGTVVKSVTGVIKRATVPPEEKDAAFSATGYTVDFNGAQQRVASASFNVTDYPGLTGEISYSIDTTGDPESRSYVTGRDIYRINAASYPVTFKFVATGNYTGTYYREVVGQIKQIPIPPEEKDAAFVATPYTRIFNNTEQVVADAHFNAALYPGLTGTIRYSIDGGQTWNNSSSYSETLADTYPVRFEFVAGGNYSGTYFQDVDGIINPYVLTGAELEAAFRVAGYDNLFFTGFEQTVARAWFDDVAFPGLAGTIEMSTTMPASYVAGDARKETAAGTYPASFRFTATGNYVGTDVKDTSGTIKPDSGFDPTLAFSAEAYEETYTGTPLLMANASFNLDEYPTLTGTIEYSTDNGSTWIEEAEYYETDAGTYPVMFKFTVSGDYEGEYIYGDDDDEELVGVIKAKSIDDPDFDKEAAFLVKGYDELTYNELEQLVAEAWFNTELYPGLAGTISMSTSTEGAMDTKDYTTGVDERYEKPAADYPTYFCFEATGNYTGTHYVQADGKIWPKKFEDEEEIKAAFLTGGYKKVFNEADQVVADAWFNTTQFPGLTGTISYNATFPVEFKPGAEFEAKEVGEYPVTFRFTASGNYTGIYDIDELDGAITARPLDEIKDAAFKALGYDDLIFNEANQLVAEAWLDTVTYPGLAGTITYNTSYPENWQDGESYLAMDVGTYPVTFRFVASGNYSGSHTITVTGEIHPKEITDPDEKEAAFKVKGYTETYNGSEQLMVNAWFNTTDFPGLTGTISMSTDATGDIKDKDYATGDALYGIEAGSYPAYFRFVASGNYTGTYYGTDTGIINPRVDGLDENVAFIANGYSLPYTGSPQVIADASFNTVAYPGLTGTIMYSDDPAARGVPNHASWRDLASVEQTEADTYPGTFKFTVSGNYEGVFYKEADGAITRTDISTLDPALALVTNEHSKTFNEQLQVVADAAIGTDTYPFLTGTIDYQVPGSTDWIEASEYEALNVGDYPVTFRLTATGNYTGEIKRDIIGHITPMSIDDPGFDKDAAFITAGYKRIFNEAEQVVADAEFNTTLYPGLAGTISYNMTFPEDWQTSDEVKRMDVGTYPVTFRFVATGNYTGDFERDAVGTIDPLELTDPDDIAAAFKTQGHTATYDGTEHLMANAWFNTTDFPGLEGTISVSTETAGAAADKTYVTGSEVYGTVVGSYPAYFKFVATGNYTGTYYGNTAGVINANPGGLNPELAFIATSYSNPYTGSEQVVADASFNVADYPGLSGTIMYSFDPAAFEEENHVSWQIGSSAEAIEAADYPVYFKYVVTGNYTGTYYKTVTGSITKVGIETLDPNLALVATGYTKIFNAADQVVADAQVGTDTYPFLTGTIEYNVSRPENWVPNNAYSAYDVGEYVVDFRLTATGNYTGVIERTVTGKITPQIIDDPALKDAAFKALGYPDLIYNEAEQLVAEAWFDDVAFPGLTGTITYNVSRPAVWQTGKEVYGKVLETFRRGVLYS